MSTPTNTKNGEATKSLAKASPQQTLKTMLETMQPAFQAVLPKHMTAERMVKVVLSCTARNPALLECTTQSIARCVMQASELGLEAGGLLGEAYLVPFRNGNATEATLICGYKGLISLARRSGQILSISSYAVYEKDEFSLDLGNDEIVHKPWLHGERGKMICVWAQAKFKDGSRQFDFLTLDEVKLIQARSKAGKSGPWSTDFAEMAKKSCVRRLCKYLPLAVEVAEAVARVDVIEHGEDVTVDITAQSIIDAAPSKARALAAKIKGNNEAQEVVLEPANSPAATQVNADEYIGPEPPADYVSPE